MIACPVCNRPRVECACIFREKPSAPVAGSAIRFTLADVQAAAEEWGFNCGPGALCAALKMTPSELRPHLLDFEAKGCTNPTLMVGVLDGLKVPHRQVYRSDEAFPTFEPPWSRFSLARIQWGGPWTKPGVPMRVRYRKTHWVAVELLNGSVRVFDVNAVCVGGWLPYAEWATRLVPWLIRECVPRGDGSWWVTHGIEILRNDGGEQ